MCACHYCVHITSPYVSWCFFENTMCIFRYMSTTQQATTNAIWSKIWFTWVQKQLKFYVTSQPQKMRSNDMRLKMPVGIAFDLCISIWNSQCACSESLSGTGCKMKLLIGTWGIFLRSILQASQYAGFWIEEMVLIMWAALAKRDILQALHMYLVEVSLFRLCYSQAVCLSMQDVIDHFKAC